MKYWAADDYETIRARRAQIMEEEMPRCPMIAGRLLHECLRSVGPCLIECPNHNDWIGPQE